MGEITIDEEILLQEIGSASEESAGHSQKQTVCANFNEDNVGLPPPGGDCINVCFPDDIGNGPNPAPTPVP